MLDLEEVFNCLVVSDASSSPIKRPVRVTMMAASLIMGGIVKIGVFKGMMFEVIKRPARMLPQANRPTGPVSRGPVSLIGEKEFDRGWPIDTK